MMRGREGLAEELSRLFYNKSGPTLRAVQRRISQPGSWWKFANVFGLILGGLMIVSSGFLPWWEHGTPDVILVGFEPDFVNGLEIMRGQAAFSLGIILVVMGLARWFISSGQARLVRVSLSLLLALAVIGLALVERDRGNPIDFDSNALISFLYPVLFALGEGYYLALYGGIIAFFGSLCGLAPDPDPAADPPPRLTQDLR